MRVHDGSGNRSANHQIDPFLERAERVFEALSEASLEIVQDQTIILDLETGEIVANFNRGTDKYKG